MCTRVGVCVTTSDSCRGATVINFIFLSTEIVSNLLYGDWQWTYTKIMYHSGHIYKEIQLQFAESVAKVVSLAPWTWQDQNSSAAYVFNNWL
ncbi:hypothetical protein K435DRAFT_162377 [Dendrothele bispora CBS 962.96]|uniref:Uncharacterized protein n=1 Tax=Dendrothele bispora (strain CBS 962.96) TaxID=1314807 RepID=A0A4V6T5N9_DENBC|nr:hypothetical protein K435DRAFT_162377 [Dendrothele bispora CBS 962.96]